MADDNGNAREGCDARWSDWLPVVLAASASLGIGYFVGRGSFRQELVLALCRADQSAEPIEVRI